MKDTEFLARFERASWLADYKCSRIDIGSLHALYPGNGTWLRLAAVRHTPLRGSPIVIFERHLRRDPDEYVSVAHGCTNCRIIKLGPPSIVAGLLDTRASHPRFAPAFAERMSIDMYCGDCNAPLYARLA